MLQSLFALTSVAQHDPAKAQPILQNQLPVLTQRIELLLAKLKAPSEAAEEIQMPLFTWWESVKQRHQHRDVEWVLVVCSEKSTLTPTPLPEGEGLNPNHEVLDPNHEVLNPNPLRPNSLAPWERAGVREPLSTAHEKLRAPLHLIPAPLSDCVLDNLLENACNKRLREPGIHITARLSAAPLSIEVIDTGSAVPPHIAGDLLRTVVTSEDGLGVGLYQAARWAQQLGYALRLKNNQAGAVRFEFKPLAK